jgi:hypothetical protein
MANDNHPIFDPVNSPLNSAEPDALNTFITPERLNEVMNKDVVEMQNADVADIVRYYQKEREKFVLLDGVAKEEKVSKKPKGSKKVTTTPGDAVDLLNEIDF